MESTKPAKIEYPFIHILGTIIYSEGFNQYMVAAKEYAKNHSLDESMPNASVIVRNGKILAYGANGSEYHANNVCERVKQNIPTGQGYELCEGCHPKNHSESSAILSANTTNVDIRGAEIYLWGHWWCCEPCWNTMIESGINTVHLLAGSEHLFNRESKKNIIGHQFE
jgi:deoxycytidylate deaminase